jgi:hypothetical protein
MMKENPGSPAPRQPARNNPLGGRGAVNRHSMSFAALVRCKLVVLAAFLLCPAAHAQTTDTVIGLGRG